MKNKFSKKIYKKPSIRITNFTASYLGNRDKSNQFLLDNGGLLEAHWVRGSWST